MQIFDRNTEITKVIFGKEQEKQSELQFSINDSGKLIIRLFSRNDKTKDGLIILSPEETNNLIRFIARIRW